MGDEDVGFSHDASSHASPDGNNGIPVPSVIEIVCYMGISVMQWTNPA